MPLVNIASENLEDNIWSLSNFAVNLSNLDLPRSILALSFSKLTNSAVFSVVSFELSPSKKERPSKASMPRPMGPRNLLNTPVSPLTEKILEKKPPAPKAVLTPAAFPIRVTPA